MGYESRVIIGRKLAEDCVEKIAELNLSKMGEGFLSLFDREYKVDFYDFYNGDNKVEEDRYGKPLTYAPFNRVYKYCLDTAQRDNYRRLHMLLAVLNVVRQCWDDYEDFVIIHYGY